MSLPRVKACKVPAAGQSEPLPLIGCMCRSQFSCVALCFYLADSG